MNNDEMVLRIRNDKSIRLEFKENGENRTKIISVDTLIECVKNSLSGFQVNTGILPANTLSVTVDTEKAQRYVTMEFPDETATVTYMQTEYPDFPLPRLLFGFRSNFRRQYGCAGSRQVYAGHEDVLLSLFQCQPIQSVSGCKSASAYSVCSAAQ